MKRPKHPSRLILSLLVLCILVGCRWFFPERTTQEMVYTGPQVEIDYGEEVVQLSSAELNESLVAVVEDTDGTVQFTFQEPAATAQSRVGVARVISDVFTPGMVTILEATELLPEGLVFRVDTITYQGDGVYIVVGVRLFSLPDILHISFETSFFESALGEEVVVAPPTHVFEITSATSISVTLSLTIADGYVYLYYDKQTDELLAKLRFQQSGTITVLIEGELEATQIFEPLTLIIPLEGVGIPAHIEIGPFIKVTGGASGSFTYEINEYSEIEYKIRRSGGVWIEEETGFSGFPPTISGSSPTGGETTLWAKGVAGIKASLKLFHFVGPFFSFGPYLLAEIESQKSGSIERLGYGFELSWGIEATLFGLGVRKAWDLTLPREGPIPIFEYEHSSWSGIRQLGSPDYDWSNGVAVDANGNVYVAGYTEGNLGGSNQGSYDIVLVKYDSAGIQQWIRQLGSPDYDRSAGVAVDANGNVYVAGSTEGNLDGSNQGGNDIVLVKYDSAGIQQWIHQLGSPASDRSAGVAVDANGYVYVAGHTYESLGGPNQGGWDIVLVKYDSAGNLQ